MQLRLILLLALLFNVDILDAAKKKKKPKPSKKPAKKPAVNPSPGGGAGDCGISVELGNTWNQGQDGILKIKFPKAVKKWTIELVYDKPVKTLTFFEGKESGSGKKFTVKNENWNGVNKAGASLDLRYQTQFSDSNVPPKLTSLKFNGKQCSLGGAGGTGGTTLSPGKTSGAPTKTTAASGGKSSTTGRTTVVPGGKTSTTGRTTVAPGGTTGTPGGKTTWSGGATPLMTSLTPQESTASPEVTTSAPPGCTFRGVSIAVGSRLPLPAKCSWLVCSALTMGGSTVASMDLQGKQGCNCCLGDDGDMYADGETHYLENGEKTACYMGNWIVILPPNPVGTTIIPGGTTENVEGTDFTSPAHVGSTGEGMTPAPGGTTPPSKVTTPAQGGTTQSTGGGGSHCGISVELGNTWNQGQDGKLKIKFPSTVSTWAIELIYDNPLNSISFYTAKERGSGREFTIKNEDWNGANPAGAVLDLDYQIQFPQSNVPPKITSIKFNGKECSLGGGGGGEATTGGVGHTTPYQAGTSGAPAASTPSVTAAPCTTNGTKYDYGEVLRLSNLFYQAQRSGPLDVLGDFNHDLIPYRGDSATEDGSDNGVDLSGGYYDAGDYVKFNFPMAAATTLIGWGAADYQDGYETTSQHEQTLNTIRWTTDYLIKCHSDPQVFWAQVGDGNADHAEWDRVEDMTIPRPSYKLDKNNPGSDLAGESAAALAAASIAFKDKDPAYSAELLSHAKAYFDFADTYRGKYSDSVPNAASFYNSWSGYNDELVWGAAWLYKATGEVEYLEKAESLYQDKNANEFSWDDKTAGAQVLLAQLTGKAKYVSKAKAFCDKMVDQQAKTPKGMVWIQQWGPLRHASNVAFICLEVASIDDPSIDVDKYRQFAMDQIHYALGDTGRSFVIGFGDDFPKKPHHRSSSCPKNPSDQCGWDALNNPGPNPSTLWGALVGGPGQDDSYEDKRDDYIKNEVACDYNAGFQSAVAGLRTLANQGLLPSHTCPSQGSAGGGSSEGGSNGGGSGPVSVTAGPGTSGGEDKVTAYGDAWQGNNCGFIKMPSAHAETYFVAMPNDYYNAGATCGVCVKLSTPEKSLIVYGMNRCPECHYHVPGESHWDLSNSAYRFLIGEPLGIGSDLTHEIVPCPENVVAGNMQIFTKDGSNPYWNAFQPVNFRIKVEGMSLSMDGGNSWKALRGPGEHYVDGFYYLNDSINLSGSYKLRVHSASGDIDVDMSGVQAKSFVDTGKQN